VVKPPAFVTQRNRESDFGVMRPLIRVSLFNADSENDFTLLEDKGEYFVSFANRILHL
jgi:hypothetical protein